jgi:hypothetical protein
MRSFQPGREIRRSYNDQERNESGGNRGLLYWNDESREPWAGAFEGVWKVKDTAGQPFEITLSSGGIAKATRGEGMTGTWKEEGNAAVITWNTGWTTKITKEGNQYKKTAYRKGQALDAPPANSSDAERAK